jgi:glycosyltransferase involved in cell wall biosynthesis
MQKEDYCMRAADHVVTISEAMRDLLVERGVSKDRIDVVPNGVDENAFLQSRASGAVARERHGLNGHIVVGCISNMSRREGHDVLIQAVGKLVDSGIEAKCLLVGDGPERNRLEQLAKSLGIGERIVFTGEIDHKEIHEYYRAMDLFVVPRRPDFASDYATPLTSFEAMALGVPVVVSNRPAFREIVGNRERGMLFQAESVDSLVSVLKESIAIPDHRLTLADAARTWIMRERTWQTNCRKYVELYEKVISEFASAGLPRYPRETAEL